MSVSYNGELWCGSKNGPTCLGDVMKKVGLCIDGLVGVVQNTLPSLTHQRHYIAWLRGERV